MEPLSGDILDEKDQKKNDGKTYMSDKRNRLEKMTETGQKISHWDIRDKLVEMTQSQLIGPVGGEEETLKIDPHKRYLVGAIAPQQQIKNQTLYDEVNSEEENVYEDDEVSVEPGYTEEGDAESPVGLATPTFEPASYGMTFSVDKACPELFAYVRFGQYKRDTVIEDGKEVRVWKRFQVHGQTQPFQLKKTPKKGSKLELSFRNGLDYPDVYIKAIIRDFGNCWIVTLFLLNDRPPKKTNKSEAYLFQSRLEVHADGNPVFVKRMKPQVQSRLDALEKSEKQAMDMLYRNHVEFAVGHGVSVHAKVDKKDQKRAYKIETRAIPSYEVPQVEHQVFEGLITDMKALAEMPISELKSSLMPLVESYDQWINSLKETLTNSPDEFSEYGSASELAIARCLEAKDRIQKGIELLEQDDIAAQSFQAANYAMYQQRIHSIWSLKRRRGESKLKLQDIDEPRNRSWRPFQLAFVLINITGLTQFDHSERSDKPDAVADLLWFPTGGGKTEAYLGLTAYTLFMRRLHGVLSEGNQKYSGMDGVAVLMRYTLRLLTLQQFQRAAALICACEMMRKENSQKWGTTPFRIGLWVGQNTTPNRTEDSAKALEDLKSSKYTRGSVAGSPLQLTHCPWCGTVIDENKNIVVESFPHDRGRTLVYCENYKCNFSQGQYETEGIPIVVVDEEIYRLLPSLVIATVDKFAQMPWKGEIQMLFGQITGKCTRHGFRSPDMKDSDRHNRSSRYPAATTESHPLLRPPDLIIQDELHLISGPLGSMVGLYETAVERLCSWKYQGRVIRPKIVLSTATIRRAANQVKELFNHEVKVFPPHGLDIEDNFFAKQVAPSEKKPGRRYLGVCAPGRKLKETTIEVYATLLGVAQTLYQEHGELVDPWMTLVGYFNTIRELGGTRRLVTDDIKNVLHDLSRGFEKRYIADNSIAELTSRLSSDKIPEILDHLEDMFDLEKDEERRKAAKVFEETGKYDGPRRPLDVLLATNMISVGVDIERLGLMVMSRQPKTTAEYIQASSRVGRSKPGLIFTMYNWAHPRDLSHYEVFEHYHETFYKHVEAISVTPFSPRALDRGLSALLVSLIRLSSPEFNTNDAAEEVQNQADIVQDAIQYICQRAEEVRTGDNEIKDLIQDELNARMDEWQTKRKQFQNDSIRLGYKAKKDGKTLGLLSDPAELDPENPGQTKQWERFTCLNSLRNVELQMPLVLSKVRKVERQPIMPMSSKNQEGEQ